MIRILAVCTGNSCRSPMFAALLSRELRERGIAAEVRSAGTAAEPGGPASAGAIAAMAGRGLDIRGHRATPVEASGATGFDRVYAVSSRHAAAVRALGVEARRLSVLGAERGGIPDPWGGDARVYDACAAVLADEAAAIAGEIAAGAPT